MEIIEHQELASAQSSIVFTDIPQTFTDLVLVMSARTNRSDPNIVDVVVGKYNASTTGYSYRELFAGNSPNTNSGSNFFAGYTSISSATANTFGSSSLYIPNYTSSLAKSSSMDGVSESNGINVFRAIAANLWTGTEAIETLTLTPLVGTLFESGSSATLYGIKSTAGTGAPKATGGIISFDAVNNKWVHAFTASGTFTPTENLTTEYLVIAGGGGGGNDIGGGGGAGGYRSSVQGESSGRNSAAESPINLTQNTGYTVTVGAGGASGAADLNGTNGSNSVFGSITSLGGGGGAHAYLRSAGPGASGGSGGGGAIWTGTSASGGAGTSGQGFDGGSISVGSGNGHLGAGGGGAGGAGLPVTSQGVASNGGVGISSSITGTDIFRGGGGGGAAASYGQTTGIGGLGGGGNGAYNSAGGSAGFVNTGGGGGGFYAGGSGIVIVRYDA